MKETLEIEKKDNKLVEKITADEVNMVIPGDENKSCLLGAIGDESYQYIVMPMRI